MEGLYCSFLNKAYIIANFLTLLYTLIEWGASRRVSLQQSSCDSAFSAAASKQHKTLDIVAVKTPNCFEKRQNFKPSQKMANGNAKYWSSFWR